MLRPFFRSLLFWLGLPGLVFLLWTWFDAGRFASGVTWTPGTWAIGLRQAEGEWVSDWENMPGRRSSSSLTYHRFPIHRSMNYERIGPVDLARPFRRQISGTTHYMVVAHWVVILCYLILWLGVWVWWQGRKSRLLKLHAAPLP